MGQKVWYLETNFLGRNKKLAPKYCGPAIIIHVNESVAKLKTEKNKLKTINVNNLKHFLGDLDANANAEEHAQETKHPNLIKFDTSTRRPLTRAWSKLIKATPYQH